MIFILPLIILTTGFVLCSLRNMHFFQLNSYKFAEHRVFLRRKTNKILLIAIISALNLFGLLIKNQVALAIYLSLVALIFAFDVVPVSRKKSKKPLVFTARVKRMFFTEILLYALAVICFALFAKLEYAPLFAFCIMLFAPYFCLLANIINAPVEKAIKNHYTNDAKRILYSHPNLKVIGITGSFGKTSTKEYLTTLLSEKYNVLMTKGNYNTPMGVVLTVRNQLKATHEIFVCEMGAKYVNDIKELCLLARPCAGIITSIGAQHLDTFHSFENIVSTKLELADYLFEKEGKLYVCNDSEPLKNADIKGDCIRVGASADSDALIYGISADEKGTSFTLRLKDGKEIKAKVNLLGAHNVTNVALSMVVAYDFGLNENEILRGLKKIKSAEHRLQLKHIAGNIVIDDAYNANPAGTKAALNALELIDGYKIIVTPGMVELSNDTERYNKEFGENCAKVCDKIVLVGKNQTKPIYEGAVLRGFDKNNIAIFEDVKEAISYAYRVNTEKRRVILIENDLPDNY